MQISTGFFWSWLEGGNSLRILQVIPYFEWSYGGPVRVVHNLSRCLTARGNKVTVMTTDVGRYGRLASRERIVPDGAYELIYCRCTNNWMAERMMLHFSEDLRRTLKARLGDFDVVHLHEWRGIPNLYTWISSKESGTPYIIQPHGAAERIIGDQSKMVTLSKMVYDTVVGKRIVADASRIIALTKSEASRLMGYGIEPERITTIPNAFDQDAQKLASERKNFREMRKIPDDARIILYVGRLHQSKGLDMLVRAYAKVASKCVNCRLVLIGPDDGYGQQLRRDVVSLGLGDNDVVFTGFVDDDEKASAYSSADLFVTPQFYGMPLTFLDACYYGVPIVTTNHGDSIDWLDGKVGRIAEYTESSIAATIMEVLGDTELRKAFSCNARRIARETFDWTKVAAQYEDLYRDCMNNRS